VYPKIIGIIAGFVLGRRFALPQAPRGMKFRFTIRDLFWATLFVALAFACILQRWSLMAWNRHLESEVHSLTKQLEESDHNLDHLAKMLHEQQARQQSQDR
jgi:hypothetical protein